MAELQAVLDSQRQKIDVDNFDLTIREILNMVRAGEIRRAPSYQRKFRWTEDDESRLIESIFLGLPIPSIFVATNPDGTWELVDGLQRISTVMHFALDPNDEVDRKRLQELAKDAPLVLMGLEKLKQFNGLSFSDIPQPLQLLFGKRQFRVTALSDKSDLSVRFELFERLNRGGIALSPQEVRDCIYRGPFADLVDELASKPRFRKLLKLQKLRQNDGTLEEQVLKFFAYLNRKEEYKGDVTDFLNSYMEKRAKDKNLNKDREEFLGAIDVLWGFTKGPVLREGFSLTPLNQFEAILVAAAELRREGNDISKPRKGWLNDTKLVHYSTRGTNTPSMLKGRIGRAKELLSGAKVEID